MHDRGHLLTEQPNPRSAELDALSLTDAFDVMNAEHAGLARAVQDARAQIVAAVELIERAFRCGGRLIYVGAGTSGRLGVLDAAECPPTFLTDPEMVQGVIAGGDAALRRSIEHAEDDPAAGAAAVDERGVGQRDVVFGIATGGTTPFVHGALRRAAQRGARTVFLACVPREQAADSADVSIRVLTGPEALTGSTRLKAGIATKMVLNIVSTLAMVRLGKVYGNLMVDVDAGRCAKLTDRAVRIVMVATDLPREAAKNQLAAAGGQVKTAIVMARRGVDRDAARLLLAEHAGSIRAVLDATE
jgi:N-acetylmuramic acid 6-phosphate etherase